MIRTGSKRLLTSGQRQRAVDGLDLLEELVRQAAARTEIVAGSGVSSQNVCKLKAAGVNTLHSSGSSKNESDMNHRKEGISMASNIADEYQRMEANEQCIRSVVNMICDKSTAVT